jgi:hypothetical protein
MATTFDTYLSARNSLQGMTTTDSGPAWTFDDSLPLSADRRPDSAYYSRTPSNQSSTSEIQAETVEMPAAATDVERSSVESSQRDAAQSHNSRLVESSETIDQKEDISAANYSTQGLF